MQPKPPLLVIDTSTHACLLHYHIHLSAATQADISWWLTFAKAWNGRAFFVDLPWTLLQHSSYSRMQATRVLVPTEPDSPEEERHPVVRTLRSGSCSTRLGQALVTQTLVDPLRQPGCGPCLAHRHYQTQVTHGSSQSSILHSCLSELHCPLAIYFQGINNSIADALSHFQFHRFHRLAPAADTYPTPIPVIEITT